jgi:predicted transcriptional regulator
MEHDPMTTITIELEPEFASRLQAEATARDISVSHLVGDWLDEWLEDEAAFDAMPLSPEEIAGIERGLADIEAGRVISHEQMLAELAKWRDE